MATLSIVVPNYNHARYLPESLSALTSQSRPADEIIVIDDASTDNSIEVIRGFAERYSNLRLKRNPANLGVVTTMNAGLKMARGDYVYFAAADDRVLPGFFEQSMAMLERYPQAGLCFSDPASFEDGSEKINEGRLLLERKAFFLEPADLILRLRRRRFWPPGHTTILKTAALRQIGGFDPDLRWYSDWFAYLTIAFIHRVCYLPSALAAFRVSPNQYSAPATRTLEQQRLICSRILELLDAPERRNVAEAFKDSLALAIHGLLMWKIIGSDRRWHQYRSYRLLSCFIQHDIGTLLAERAPAVYRGVSRIRDHVRGYPTTFSKNMA